MSDRVFTESTPEGLSSEWRFRPNGEIVIKHTQDVEAILERNKRLQNELGKGFTKSGDMRYVGSIPMVIVMKWKTELGVDVFNPDHHKKVMQLLKDPEYRYLRTSN